MITSELIMTKKTALLAFIIVWIIITIIYSKYDTPADGFTLIGFPFHFYSYFSGKTTGICKMDNGFHWDYFVFDMIIATAFFTLIFLFQIFLSNFKKKNIKPS